jgi:ATP-dependent Clp protease ATP-binding subunit ClpC
MNERFTDRARKVMQLANQAARDLNHEYIGTEHILLGLLKEGCGVAANVLKNLGTDLRRVREEVEKIVQGGPEMVTMGKLPQTPRARKVIEYSLEEARNLNHDYVGTEHVLLGLLREQEGVAAQVLMNLGLKLEDVREEVLNLLGHNMDSGESRAGKRTRGKRKSGTPVLDGFSRDLTELARQGKLDPVIRRTNEMQRVVRILSRRARNSPVLLGEAGAGKTAVVRGVAQLLTSPAGPPVLSGRRVVAVEQTLLVADTSYRGQLESRLKKIRAELRRDKTTILFLDDLHLWGSTLGMDAGLAMLLADVPCIAATTSEGFARLLETARTLARWFVPVPVAPLSSEEVLEVLRGLRERYEVHHRVMIADEALEEVVACAERARGSPPLIERALDLLDEAAADLRLRTIPPPPDLGELDAQIEHLNQEKESAVADHDFELAAHLRDNTGELMRKKQAIMQTWREQVAREQATVDVDSIRRIANEM